MSFPLYPALAWNTGQRLLSAELNAWRLQWPNAVDGKAGGSYALTDGPLQFTTGQIEFLGDCFVICDATGGFSVGPASQLYVEGDTEFTATSDMAIRGTPTFYNTTVFKPVAASPGNTISVVASGSLPRMNFDTAELSINATSNLRLALGGTAELGGAVTLQSGGTFTCASGSSATCNSGSTVTVNGNLNVTSGALNVGSGGTLSLASAMSFSGAGRVGFRRVNAPAGSNASYTVSQGNVLYIDAGGASRDYTLSPTGANTNDFWLVINAGNLGGTINIKDGGGSTITSYGNKTAGLFMFNGTQFERLFSFSLL